MQQGARTTIASLMEDIEDTCKKFDELYGGLKPAQWSRKYGKDWTFADQPYHLAYFDRTVANSIAKGPAMPEEERVLLRTMGELNAWNAREFAKRPASQSVEQSLELMRASRQALRQVVAPLTDADLNRQAWMPIFAGWVTVRDGLVGCITHNWGEFIETRLRLGRKTPGLRPSATHHALNFYMAFPAMTLNRELAARIQFTMVMNFTGPGGGAWTFRVADGRCTVTEEQAAQPNLVITQRPETFVKLLRRMRHPMLLMLTGQMKVRGMRKIGTFAKLFPQPKPDQVLALGPEGAALG